MGATPWRREPIVLDDSRGEADPQLEALRARRLRSVLDERQRANVRPAGSPTPVRLTRETFTAFLEGRPRVVVDVWAPWCGPCRGMAPILDQLAAQWGGRVGFGKLNADEEPGIAAEWNVQGIPTLLVFENGRLIDRVVGAVPKPVLDARLHRDFQRTLPPEPE